MNAQLHPAFARQRHGTAELTEILHHSLDRKYSQLRAAAQNIWERKFAGRDPSDACVSVRISSGSKALDDSRRILHWPTGRAA